MGILEKTKCYTIGHMQYISGEGWREHLKKELNSIGVDVWTPYDKPMLCNFPENDETRKQLSKDMENGNYDLVEECMRRIRGQDLRLCDLADFSVAHLYPEIASWGSGEELTTMTRQKKPLFISIEGGKKKCPLWILGMIPHKYIYDSVDDIIEMIFNINSGKVPIDSNRWKLLQMRYR